MRIRLLLVLSAALAALALAPAAEAKVWFESLRGLRVEPFALVSTGIDGCNGTTNCIPGLTGTPVFAKPVGARLPRRCAVVEARKWPRAGRITYRSTLRFRAPDRPGRYELVALLHDAGECYSVPASPPFRVVRPPAS